MSVSHVPEGCLRHWCSSAYLRISLLHAEFHPPLTNSSRAVTNAVPRLSPGISHLSCTAACAPFTPSNSGQRLHPTFYRGCWHVVSRCLFFRYRQRNVLFVRPFSSLTKAVYNPKAFIPHAAWLDQGFPHCPKFPTAASRRSLGRVSVPMWLIILSDQLLIVALVSFYLTN